MNESYTFDADGAKRIVDVVRTVERELINTVGEGGRSGVRDTRSVTVRVTAGPDADGVYPGKYVKFSGDPAPASRWVDITTAEQDCWLIMNGATISDAYSALVIGVRTSDKIPVCLHSEDGPPTYDWFYALPTGGDDTVGWSWKRINLATPHDYVDAVAPAPLTGTNNAWRAPSNTPGTVPTGATAPIPLSTAQAILIRPSPTVPGQYEIAPGDPLGSFSASVVSNVACVSGSLQVTFKTLKVMGRGVAGSLD